MSDIHFECEKCHQHLTVESAGAGESIACPNCGAPLVVPLPAMPPDFDCATTTSTPEATRSALSTAPPVAAGTPREPCAKFLQPVR